MRTAIAELHFMRYLPRSSPIHRLWAGTKLIGVAAFSVALSVNPSWGAEAILGIVLGLAIVLARVPISVAPRLPAWFGVAILVSGLANLSAGGAPVLHVGHVKLGVGALGLWALYLVMTIELLTASALVGWTTVLADLAPALSRLLGPFRRLRLPVDEVVVAIALSVRCLPLLIDEIRILLAARRARGSALPPGLRAILREIGDLLSAVLATSARRASEMGAAIQARGGLDGAVGKGEGPAGRDGVALVVVAMAAAAMMMV